MRGNSRVIAVSTLLCLIAFLFTQFETSHGNASFIIDLYPKLPRITIESDGTISPSDMPIKKVGEVYYLTGSISYHTIGIRRDNITLDGQGFTVLGNTTMAGIGITILANNVTVRNLVVRTFPVGIEPIRAGGGAIPKEKGVNIVNNTISDCNSAIALVYEANNLVSWNVLKDNENSGIHIRQGYRNTIDGNIITNNTKGIHIEDTNQNTISHNTIAENHNGAYLSNAQVNIFTKNNFTRNDCGVNLIGSNDNQFYLNNFMDNSIDAELSNSLHNSWNNGSMGNYWSDYLKKNPNASDIGGSGIGDTSYVIDETNTDRYPLMEPFNVAHPRIWVLSPVNQAFNESSVSLSFTVDKQANWMGYSLDGQDNVTVTGNITISGLASGLHNVTVYAKDMFGNEGASETIAFTVALAPFPTTLVIAPASVAVMGVGLLIYFKKRKR